MNVIEYIENDWPCSIGSMVKEMALKEGVVHLEYGEVIVNEKNGNDIDVVIDGNPMTVRINGYDDKRKYSYISLTLIDQKTKREICSCTVKRTLDVAKMIKEL